MVYLLIIYFIINSVGLLILSDHIIAQINKNPNIMSILRIVYVVGCFICILAAFLPVLLIAMLYIISRDLFFRKSK